MGVFSRETENERKYKNKGPTAFLSAMAGNIVGFFDGGKPGCGCDQLQGRLCYVWIYLALYCNCPVAVPVQEKTADGRTGGVFDRICMGAEAASL